MHRQNDDLIFLGAHSQKSSDFLLEKQTTTDTKAKFSRNANCLQKSKVILTTYVKHGCESFYSQQTPFPLYFERKP